MSKLRYESFLHISNKDSHPLILEDWMQRYIYIYRCIVVNPSYHHDLHATMLVSHAFIKWKMKRFYLNQNFVKFYKNNLQVCFIISNKPFFFVNNIYSCWKYICSCYALNSVRKAVAWFAKPKLDSSPSFLFARHIF